MIELRKRVLDAVENGVPSRKKLRELLRKAQTTEERKHLAEKLAHGTQLETSSRNQTARKYHKMRSVRDSYNELIKEKFSKTQ